MPELKLEKVHYRNRKIEPVWHVQAAVLVAIALQLLLDSRLTVGPKTIVIGVEVALFISLALLRPGHKRVVSRARNLAALLLIGLVSFFNFASLVLVIIHLFHHTGDTNSLELIASALSIYVTNIIIFGLWYWELDSNGVQGQSVDIEPIDFLFPQMNMHGAKARAWAPTFFDYLYLSITNGTAFSTTDAQPLTHRAKLLMAIQSFISIAVVALVITRGVSLLS